MTCFGLNQFGSVGGEFLVGFEPYPTSEEQAGINQKLFDELYQLQHKSLTEVSEVSYECAQKDPKVYLTLKVPYSRRLIPVVSENSLPHEVVMLPDELYRRYVQEVETIEDVQQIVMGLPTNPALLKFWGIN